MQSPRIAPAEPPFAPEIAAALERIMPKGVPPLSLFTTLARNPRVFGRFMAGGLLDPGTLTLRQREIAIDRVCAACACEYEWGVHIAFFGERAGLDAEQRRAIVQETSEASCWAEDERAIIALVDALHDSAEVPEALWHRLTGLFSEEQILELLVLTGFYHTVSFVANGLRLRPEAFAARFEDLGQVGPRPGGRAPALAPSMPGP